MSKSHAEGFVRASYAALQTVIATAKHKGEEVFQALVKLMGIPVLPFLEGSSP
jgi:hypothetical protein